MGEGNEHIGIKEGEPEGQFQWPRSGDTSSKVQRLPGHPVGLGESV